MCRLIEDSGAIVFRCGAPKTAILPLLSLAKDVTSSKAEAIKSTLSDAAAREIDGGGELSAVSLADTVGATLITFPDSFGIASEVPADGSI